MTYYVVPMLIFYFGVALSISYGGTSKAVLFACATPMILLACLRGHSGTDTGSYFNAFAGLIAGPVEYGGEPLFAMLSQILWSVVPDPRFVVNTISLMIAATLLWGISSARYGAWFGGLVLVPALFYELTMNVLRFGVASSLFLLASRVPFNQRPVRYVMFALIATGMHFSAALLFILFIGTTQRRQILLIVLLALLVLGGAFAMPGYLDAKTDLYSEMTAPNATSGLLFLLLQMMLVTVMIRFRHDFHIPTAGVWLCTIMAFGTYIMTQFTYAGIRFQLILFYLMVVVLLRQYAPVSGRVSSRLVLWLLLIGLAGFAGRLHNMLDEQGHGPSPFLPYHALPSLEKYR